MDYLIRRNLEWWLSDEGDAHNCVGTVGYYDRKDFCNEKDLWAYQTLNKHVIVLEADDGESGNIHEPYARTMMKEIDHNLVLHSARYYGRPHLIALIPTSMAERITKHRYYNFGPSFRICATDKAPVDGLVLGYRLFNAKHHKQIRHEQGW